MHACVMLTIVFMEQTVPSRRKVGFIFSQDLKAAIISSNSSAEISSTSPIPVS